MFNLELFIIWEELFDSDCDYVHPDLFLELTGIFTSPNGMSLDLRRVILSLTKTSRKTRKIGSV